MAEPVPGTVRTLTTQEAVCARCEGAIVRVPPVGAWWHEANLLVDCPKNLGSGY